MPDLYTFLMPFDDRTYIYLMDEDTNELLISGYLVGLNYEKYDLCPIKRAEVYSSHITIYIELPY